MSDAECVALLQWALPRLGLRWQGFRRVRRQVCRRIETRRLMLRLPDPAAYRAYLEAHPEEWAVLDGLCRVTISRFYRDRRVFELLEREVLPDLAQVALARGAGALEAWSAGCASGEEPYTLVVVWELGLAPRFPGLGLRVLATDLDEAVLRRAEEASYGASSLKELPPERRERCFERTDCLFRLRPGLKGRVRLLRHDVRTPPPDGPFDLVLCRNVAFTYLDEEAQRSVCRHLAGVLRPGGALVIGAHEALPEDGLGFEPWPDASCIYRLERRRGASPRS